MEVWQKDLLEVLRDITQRIPGSYIDDIDRGKVIKQIDSWREQVGNVAKPNACAQLAEGWRDASKELPPADYEIYFIYDKKGSMGFAHYLGDGIFGGWPDVIAWMPLPSPPAFV